MRKSRDLVLKGNTPDQRLNHAEIVLARLARRMNKRIVGVIPPMLVGGFTSFPGPEGVLFKSLILVRGTIIRVGLFVESYATKNLVPFKVELKNKLGKNTTRFETRRAAHIETVSIKVDPGDRLSFYTLDERSEEEKAKAADIISGIWTGCLIKVEMEDCDIKSRLIEELDSDEGISDNFD